MTEAPNQRKAELNPIVLAILIAFAVLALALAGMFFLAKLNRARVAPAMSRATISTMASIDGALKLYAANRGQFPTGSDTVLTDLTVSSTFGGRLEQPYLEAPPLDAWNRPIHYQYPPPKTSGLQGPALWSDGPNGVNENGNGDDIRNW